MTSRKAKRNGKAAWINAPPRKRASEIDNPFGYPRPEPSIWQRLFKRGSV